MSRENGDAGPSHRDTGALTNGNVMMGNANTLDNQPFARDETEMPVSSRPTDTRLEGSTKHTGSIPRLRELVTHLLNSGYCCFLNFLIFDICP